VIVTPACGQDSDCESGRGRKRSAERILLHSLGAARRLRTSPTKISRSPTSGAKLSREQRRLLGTARKLRRLAARFLVALLLASAQTAQLQPGPHTRPPSRATPPTANRLTARFAPRPPPHRPHLLSSSCLTTRRYSSPTRSTSLAIHQLPPRMPSKPSGLSLSPFAMPSPVLAHFVRVTGSQSGQDRLFMVYQCASQLSLSTHAARAAQRLAASLPSPSPSPPLAQPG